MIEIKPVEMLAAVLAGSPRRPVYALVTELYPVIAGDSLFITKSVNIPLDNMGAYSDQSPTAISGFSFVLDNIVTNVNQAKEVTNAILETGTCSSTVVQFEYITQEQAKETLYTVIITGDCLADVVTIIPPVNVDYTHDKEVLSIIMNTGICSVSIIN